MLSVPTIFRDNEMRDSPDWLDLQTTKVNIACVDDDYLGFVWHPSDACNANTSKVAE